MNYSLQHLCILLIVLLQNSSWGFVVFYHHIIAAKTTTVEPHCHRHRSMACWGTKLNETTTSSSSTTPSMSLSTPLMMDNNSQFTTNNNDDDDDDDDDGQHPDQAQQQSNPESVTHLWETVIKMQSQKKDSIRIITADDDDDDDSALSSSHNIRHINSIVFTVEQCKDQKNSNEVDGTRYVLAILDQEDRVNVTQLEQAVIAATISVDSDERRNLLSLAPNEQLCNICGFSKGTIPPLGLKPPPMLTFVENSLVVERKVVIGENATGSSNNNSDNDKNESWLVGGGGQRGRFTLLSAQTLLDGMIPNVQVANFREESALASIHPDINNKNDKTSASFGLNTLPPSLGKESYKKPFFAIAPPDTEEARKIVLHADQSNKNASPPPTSPPALLKPEWVAVVGRISGVRQMARRLAFVDLAPPVVGGNQPNSSSSSSSFDDVHPWRSPSTGNDMAVQLILGKTFCQRLGVDEAELALRRLKVGQLVMIQGKTNVGNRDSLKNWITKTSLDIVVFDCQYLHLESEEMRMGGTNYTPEDIPPLPNRRTKTSSTSISTKYRQPTLSTTYNPELPILQIQDLYPNSTLEDAVHIIDDLQGVQQVQSKLDNWLTSNPRQVGLIGMDCEWKPNFLAGEESQPVLLLQLCIHPLQEIYLLDLQSLVRPLCRPTETMTEVEAAVARLMSRLYETPTLVKVGFQVTNDLQRLAASYRHITALQTITSVMEVSKLGLKVLQMTKTPKSSRLVTSSLAKMVEWFVERNLNKNEQVSDWSIRPLSEAQKEYAALDAAVTPYIAERLLEEVGAAFSPSASSFTAMPMTLVKRWENDAAFASFVTCFRFLLLKETETLAIRRWNAKRLVGDSYLVSQMWISGQNVPNLPSIPPNGSVDRPYSDLQGVVRVPSHGVSIPNNTKDKILDSLLGGWTAKSKDRCMMELLSLQDGETHNNNNSSTNQNDLVLLNQKGAKLDFPQRSGFVELANAVVLFVTMPARDGRGQSRSYPNEWLEDGGILSWFIKDHDWKGGTSKLAQKMTNAAGENKSATETTVVLFVRRGKGHFFCCGRCKVTTLLEDTANDKKGGLSSDQWSIVKLYLLLADFDKLQSLEDFKDLVNPVRKSTTGA